MRWCLVLVVVALLLGSLSPGTMARESESPVAVFITCPPGNYTLGSTVQVDVLVFNQLEPFDPEEDIRFVVGEEFREIELERTGKGIYSGSFTIFTYDIGTGGVDLKATVQHSLGGDQWVQDKRKVPIYQEALFNMELFPQDPADLFPMPGDEVIIEMRLFNGSQHIEALEDSVVIEAFGPDWRELPVEVERIGLGLYIGRFQLDPGMRTGGIVSVSGSAEALIDMMVVDDWDSFDLLIGRYRVWTHLYDVTRDSAHLDVFVRDIEGRVVPDATVHLGFGYFHPVQFIKTRNLTGTTGGIGRATFDLEYADIADEMPQGFLELEVSDGEVHQTFEQTLMLGEMPDDPWNGDYVPDDGLWIEQTVEHQLTPSSRAKVSFKAWFDGQVLRDHEVIYYLMDDLTMVEKGTIMTDGNGGFDLMIDAPDIMGPEETYDYVHLYFQTLSGGTWGGTMEGVMSGNFDTLSFHDARHSDVMTIEVGEVERGETVQVVVRHPDADGTNETPRLFWNLGPSVNIFEDESEYEIPDWTVLSPSEAETYGEMVPLTWEEDAYVAEFHLPEAFPSDWEFNLVAVMDFHGPEVTHAEGRILEVSVAGDSPIDPGQDPEPPDMKATAYLWYVLAGLVIVVVVVVVLVLVSARRPGIQGPPPGGQ